MTRLENFKAGFISENPIFGLYLGLCSALAISTTLNNALGMGVAVMAVLLLSNIIISCIRKITPSEIRIPVYIVVIATLVKIVQMLIQAYAPDLYNALGLFLPLIVVNCIILGRAEAFASKNGVLDSALDALGMGLGYTFGLLAMALIRQILATGGLSFVSPFNSNFVVFASQLFPAEYAISFFKEPVGAFFTFAVLAAIVTAYKQAESKKPFKISLAVFLAVVVVGSGLTLTKAMVDETPVAPPVVDEPVAANKLGATSDLVSSTEFEIVSVTEGEYIIKAKGFVDMNEFKVIVSDGAISSFEVVNCLDTPGIGDKITDPDFLSQFNGISSSDFEVDAISGSTYSSASAVKAAVEVLLDFGQ